MEMITRENVEDCLNFPLLCLPSLSFSPFPSPFSFVFISLFLAFFFISFPFRPAILANKNAESGHRAPSLEATEMALTLI